MTRARRLTQLRQPVLIALLAAPAWLASLGPSVADAGRDAAGGTLSISPAIIDAVVGPEGQLPSITVANGTAVRFQIRIYPALVDQMLDGGLTLRPGRANLRAAARRFALTPRAIVLAPGERATVSARLLRPVPRGEAVGAAVVEATPFTTRPNRPPPYRLRLLGALLLPGNHAPAPRGRIESVSVEQAAPGKLRFVIRERNTGKVHTYPQVRLRVVDGHGQTVLSRQPTNGVVLPAYTRQVTLETGKRFRPGRYKVEISGLFASVASRASARFTLTGRNRLQPR